MKNKSFLKGKLLGRSALSLVKGSGFKICYDAGYGECMDRGRFCEEPQCKTPFP
ncbi:hypothetical protein [Chryseobacterium arthrosphaerae]|uniref:hypothetical protein n=1 Tax=Chryseobacterium arthrosphaerae TaxID=651561 RepID=UPI0013F4DAE3|nr:hypothetical protein [Chryseobacterium arthrosphaerae]MDG4652470.1 hypothetical protein [Chryseobacterium arthrosphaerae]QUY57825.1 hypothetical protein I2F65_11005 [Chryseobacterium arthrosphaerae]UEQ77694.1 hypothetical protein J8N07_05165 [Chryseobacterium arthrosphaerae]